MKKGETTMPVNQHRRLLANGTDDEENNNRSENNNNHAGELIELFNQRVLSLATEMNIPYQLTMPQDGGALLHIPAAHSTMVRTAGNTGGPTGGYQLLPTIADNPEDMLMPLLTSSGGGNDSLTLNDEFHEDETHMPEQRMDRREDDGVRCFEQLGVNKKTFLSIMFLVLTVSVFLWETYWKHQMSCESHSQKHRFPEIERLEHIVSCAAKLSEDEAILNDPFSLQMKAALWFFTGPGRHINVPVDDPSCSWETFFGELYSLLVTRDFLHIPDATWYTEDILADASNVCHWSRVQCNDVGQITGLILNHANLTGSLPRELFGQRHLTTLDIFTNENVTGTIPTEIGRLGNHLKTLRFQSTGLTGTIPTEMGLLTGLEQLLLHDTQLVGSIPDEICRLRSMSLTTLHVDTQKVHCSCCTAPHHDVSYYTTHG